MRSQLLVALAGGVAALSFASPAIAQSDMTPTDDQPFSGFYVGGTVGYDLQPNDVGESISFDRNRDGTFGDAVTTVTGAGAFSPGFCNGQARGATPELGCVNDRNSLSYSGRIGYDRQFGHIVVGLVGEGGRSQIRDSVSAFSTTPASYTLNREIHWNAGLRARIGYAADHTLFYATGGGAYARVNNYFRTTNTANSFTTNGDTNAWGFGVGGGLEQKISKHISLGVEYLFTRLEDKDYRVNAAGGPATSPFTQGGASGTDFARSFDYLRTHTMRATVNFRF